MAAIEFYNLVVIVGFAVVCKAVLGFSKWVWAMFLRPPKNLKEYGSWAIVTGSTDGIGKAIAFELASKGLNLVLVGRNPSKLEATSNEIRERYSGIGIDIRSAVIDLAKLSGEEITQRLEGSIRGLDIGILVNNAGVGYPYARFFHEVDSELMESLIRVNADAATWVTKSVVLLMLKKKKGAIVNIGSGSSGRLCSFPLYSIYGATKAYVEMFSKCISLEYKKNGIDIQCQIPLFVATKMTKLKRSSFFIPSPEMYSKASVRWIGYESVCIPCLGHSVQWFLLRLLPQTLLDQYIFNYFFGMRKRGQLKDSARAKGKL